LVGGQTLSRIGDLTKRTRGRVKGAWKTERKKER